MSTSRQVLGLIVALAVTFAAAGVGSYFTTPAIPEWYAALPKPAWTPPAWLFGPVWTVLYTLMAVAAWLVWRRRGSVGAAAGPLALYGAQLVLNAFWSVLFFGLRRPDLALAEIGVLWLAILATMLVFWRVSTVAGVLFVPYLLWVSFAAALNTAIVTGE